MILFNSCNNVYVLESDSLKSVHQIDMEDIILYFSIHPDGKLLSFGRAKDN